MAEETQNSTTGPEPVAQPEPQNPLASVDNGGMLPANTSPPDVNFRRELDHMSRQLEGMSKRLVRLGREF